MLIAAIAAISLRKLVPCGSGADAEHLGQRLAEIRERRARAEIDAARARGAPVTSSGTYSRE